METAGMRIRMEERITDVAGFSKAAKEIFNGRFGYLLETSRRIETSVASDLPDGWEKDLQCLVMFDEKSEIRAEPDGSGICLRIISEAGGTMAVGACRDSTCLLANIRQSEPFECKDENGKRRSLISSREYFKVEDDSGMLVKAATRLVLAKDGAGNQSSGI